MKKIIMCLVLSALCLLILASCGDRSKINSAIENTRELSNIDATTYLDINMAVGFNSYHYKVTKDILSVTQESGDVLGCEVSTEYGKDDVQRDVYFDGDYAYLPNGTKQSLAEYKKYNTHYEEFINGLLVEVPSALFEADDNGNKMASVNESGGKLTMSVEFNDSEPEEMTQFTTMLEGFLGGIADRVEAYMDGENGEVSNVEYENCKLEIKIKNGYVSELTLEFEMYMDADEDDVAINAKIKTVINDPGKEVSIKFPEGYEGYVYYEMDEKPKLEDMID